MADLDLARIKRNVSKMAAQNAPIQDIDGYIASEGTTVDAVRAFREPSASPGAPTLSEAREIAKPTDGGQAATSAANKPAAFEGGAAGAAALGAMDSASFSFGDELGATLGAASEWLGSKITGAPARSRDELLAAMRDQDKRAQESNPGAYLGGQLVGAVAAPGGTAKTLTGMVGHGIASGGAYAFGSGEGGFKERIEDVPYGMAAGAGGAVIARGVGNAITKAGARKAIPTTENLEDASHALYTAADNANVVLKPKTVQKMVGNAQLGAGRLDDSVRPMTAGIVRDFQAKAGQPMGLREFDDLRKSVGLAMDGAKKEDLRTLQILKKQMDHLADNMTGADIDGGLEGVYHLKEARNLWSMKSKAETIDGMVERARTTSAGTSNAEGALRNEFKALAKNPNRMRLFTEAEQDAIMKVARGGPVQNVLSLVGKFAPTTALGALASGGAGFVGGGGVGAMALPAAGFAAKSAATNMTRGNVRTLDEIIRSGGQTVPEIIQQGRLGQGIGVPAVQRGQAINDRLRAPLALTAAELEAYRR